MVARKTRLSSKMPARSGFERRRLGSAAIAALVLGLLAGLLALPSTGAGFVAVTDNLGNGYDADDLDPPTALTATGSGPITLDWSATVDAYAEGHRILRATTPGGPYTQIAEITPSTTTSHVDSPGPGSYYYVASAFAGSWESAPSAEVSATVAAPVVGLTGAWQAGLAHTPGPGPNRMLVFIASNEQQTTSTPTLASVTYGGQPLQQVTSQQVSSTGKMSLVEIWILDETGIAAATNTTITPTWTGAPDTPLYAHAGFTNVDQTTPIGPMTVGTATADTPNPVPMAAVATTNGDMVIAAATAGEAGTYTPQNGFTLGFTQDSAVGGTTALGAAYQPANGSPETVSMLFNPASPPFINRQIVVAMVLNATS